MPTSPIRINRAAMLFGAIFALFLTIQTSVVSAGELNSRNDLCTGSNLTTENNAGCGKRRVPDPNHPGQFIYVDEKPAETAGSKANALVKDIIAILSVIVGIASVVMIIFGGFRILTSGGNPENTKSGRNAIVYALLGLIVVAFAQLIVKLVLSKTT